MVQGALDAMTTVAPLPAYLIVALLVFGEAAFFVGFVFPGETAVLLGGFLAHHGQLGIGTLIVVVVLSAVLGDTVGFEVGRILGPRVLRLRLLARHQDRLARAQRALRRRGGPAVFMGRWTAFLRAVMPGLAGLSRMRYRTFLAWNAIGGVVWGTTYCLVGYVAGASYARVASSLGKGVAAVLALVVVAALVAWHLRRKRQAATTPEG